MVGFQWFFYGLWFSYRKLKNSLKTRLYEMHVHRIVSYSYELRSTLINHNISMSTVKHKFERPYTQILQTTGAFGC